MMPVDAETRLTRRLYWSDIHKLPEESTAMPEGYDSCALVAAPPSPLKPYTPLPVTVVMIPVVADRHLMRNLLYSAMKTLPDAASTAMLDG